MIPWLLMAAHAQVVELPEGSPLASIRIRAMAGTCVSLAESSTCQIAQPAAVVIRRPGDDNDYSPDSTIQLPNHPVFRKVFGVDDPPDPNQRILLQVGGSLKVKRWGVGLSLRQERWSLAGPDRGSLRWSMPVGVSSGEAAVALSPIMMVGQFDGAVATGFGVEGGALFAPSYSPWRLGIAGHSPVRTATTDDGDALRSPWKLTLGVGYGIGIQNASRTEWIDRVSTYNKHWVQIHGELELVGDSGAAVTLLEGEHAPTAFTARLGAEGSLWEETLRVRGGSYGLVERATGGVEPHLTAGATVHLFTFLQGTRWRGGGLVDWAQSDTAFGFGLETW